MNLIQLFNCARGKHVRSRGQAHEENGVVRSRCRGCGKPMIRARGSWVVDTDPLASE